MKARGHVLTRRSVLTVRTFRRIGYWYHVTQDRGGSYGNATGLMTRIVDEPSLDGLSLMRENRTERFFN